MLKRYPNVVIPRQPVRLTWAQAETLRHRLLCFSTDLYHMNQQHLYKLARSAAKCIPTHAPYDTEFGKRHWPIVSQALRRTINGQPRAQHAKARSLYLYLIRKGYGRIPNLRPPRAP